MSKLLYLTLILVALTVGYSVQVNTNFNLDNFRNNLTWTHRNFSSVEAPDLNNALDSLVNGCGEALFSVMKWVAQVSYENPNIPFKILIYLTLFAIISPIIVMLFKLGVIIFLLTKEFIVSRKEKRIIKNLKEKKQ